MPPGEVEIEGGVIDRGMAEQHLASSTWMVRRSAPASSMWVA